MVENVSCIHLLIQKLKRTTVRTLWILSVDEIRIGHFCHVSYGTRRRLKRSLIYKRKNCVVWILSRFNVRWWRSSKFSNEVLSRHRFKTAYSSSWWWCNILIPKKYTVRMRHFFCLIPKWTAINLLCAADIRVIKLFYAVSLMCSGTSYTL